VNLLLEHGAELLIHLGDVGSLEVIDALVTAGDDGTPVEAHLVFGNVDWDADSLHAYADSLGVRVDHPVGRLPLDGERMLVFTHGHEPAAMDDAVSSGAAYLCHGHSHARRDERVNGTRVINPGGLFRASEYTVALLDTAGDDVRFFTVDSR